MRAPRLGTRALVHALVLVATAATLYPVLLVLKKAIEPGQEFALSASPVPRGLTLAHFADVVGQPHALAYVRNSFVVALATTAVGVLLSCTAAYALSRFRFPGRRLGLSAFLLSQMFPGVATAVPTVAV